MERLTSRSEHQIFTGAVLVRGRRLGKAYFDNEEDYQDYADALDKLAAYEDAEERGRLIVLPCAIGDAVWTNQTWSGWYFRESDKPLRAKIVFVGFNDSKEMGGGFLNVLYDKKGYMNSFQFSDFGKTVFFSREEAEKSLEGKP